MSPSTTQGCATNEETRIYARSLGKHDGVDDDDAGHILAHRLGGSGKEPTNIFPQAPSDNRGAWREFEGYVYDCVANGAESARIGWSFEYKSRSHTRPYQMSYEVAFGKTYANCSHSKQTFKND